jgi:hypothetical protein
MTLVLMERNSVFSEIDYGRLFGSLLIKLNINMELFTLPLEML